MRSPPTTVAWVRFLDLSLLLVLVLALRVFPDFLLPLKPTFQILIRLGNSGQKEPPRGLSTAKSLLIIIIHYSMSGVACRRGLSYSPRNNLMSPIKW